MDKVQSSRHVKGHTMDTISFTQAQYIHLCKVFPELVGNANTTNEEYRIATGQRQVVSYIGSKVSSL